MTIEVEVKGTNQVAEFPDGTPPDVIKQALAKHAGKSEEFAGAGIIEPALAVGSGLATTIGGGLAGIAAGLLPGEEGAAGQAVEAVQSKSFQPKTQSGKENLETLGQLVERGIDIVNIPISGLTGIAELVAGFGPDEAAQAIRKVQDEGLGKSAGGRVFDTTGDPLAATAVESLPTLSGELLGLKGAGSAIKGVKAATGKAAKAVEEAAPVVGEAVKAAANQTAKQIFEFQPPARQKITNLLLEGSTDAETAGFQLLDKAGKPKAVKNPLAREAMKQGFDPGVIAAVSQATKADKKAMLKMANIMERGKRNRRFASSNRPSDVVGDTLLSRVKTIRNANRASGRDIDRIAQSLKGKELDISEAVDDFAESMGRLGVDLVDDGKGGFKPNFENSQLAPGDRGPLREVIRQMNIRGAGGIDGLTVHNMKRTIDNNVTFGKVKTGMGGDAERALKSFRAKLDGALDGTFPEYNTVNVTYADTVGALDALQSAVGTKLDMAGGHADKALGQKLRGLMSNNATRINLLDAVNEIEGVARKHGPQGKLMIEGKGLGRDDLLNQILFVDELDSLFGPVARTSAQGQIDQAIKRGAKAVGTKSGAADLAVEGVANLAERVRGVNQESAFKSIKQLLKSGEQ